MKREFLEALGLEKDVIDKIMTENGKDINAAKGDLDTVKTELATAQETIKARDKQLKDLEKSTGDNEDLKKQIAELQKTNKEAAEAHTAEINKLKMDNAINSALGAAGARNSKAVRGLFDESTFKLLDSGEVEGLSAAIEAVKKSDGYLFEEKAQTSFKGFQPGASGGVKPGTEVDPSKMTYSELADYLAANPDAKLE